MFITVSKKGKRNVDDKTVKIFNGGNNRELFQINVKTVRLSRM